MTIDGDFFLCLNGRRASEFARFELVVFLK